MDRDWPAGCLQAPEQPRVRGRGVLFPALHEGRRRSCYAMGVALERLAGRPLQEHQLLSIYLAHRRRIHAAAQALLGRGIQGDPLVLDPRVFDDDAVALRQRARRAVEPLPEAPCMACADMLGLPGLVPPHAALRVFGAARQRAARGRPSASRVVFQCRECRQWLSRPHQSTPEERWRVEPPGS